LRDLDKRRGFRKPARNVAADGKRPEDHTERRWSRPIRPGDIVPAVVVEVAAGQARARGAAKTARGLAPGTARVRIGKLEGLLTRPGFQWTGRSSASDLVKAGDLIDVEVTAVDEASGTAAISLEQTPLVEGAIVAIDNRTGQIRAMVGGLDFGRSKFNRAVQAPRQIGSAFKPFVFAAAVDRGYTASSLIVDAPVSYSAGPGQPPYAPQNYDRK
jgi:penicillin-binding protein 1A